MLVVLTGKSGSGKTIISKWLRDNHNFFRISIEEARKTFFGTTNPSGVSAQMNDILMEAIYKTRDAALDAGYNVVIDTMSPTNQMRLMLLKTPNTKQLILLHPIVEEKYRRKRYTDEFRFEEPNAGLLNFRFYNRLKYIEIYPEVMEKIPSYSYYHTMSNTKQPIEYTLDFTEIWGALEKDLELGE